MRFWDIATIFVSWINVVSLSFDADHECLNSGFEALENMENEFNLSKCFECC